MEPTPVRTICSGGLVTKLATSGRLSCSQFMHSSKQSHALLKASSCTEVSKHWVRCLNNLVYGTYQLVYMFLWFLHFKHAFSIYVVLWYAGVYIGHSIIHPPPQHPLWDPFLPKRKQMHYFKDYYQKYGISRPLLPFFFGISFWNFFFFPSAPPPPQVFCIIYSIPLPMN